jgi:hypothetical protein
MKHARRPLPWCGLAIGCHPSARRPLHSRPPAERCLIDYVDFRRRGEWSTWSSFAHRWFAAAEGTA